MQRINTLNAVLDMFGPGKAGFRDGNKAQGIPATELNALFFNNIQEEIANVIESANITLDGADRTQLIKALQELFITPTKLASAVPQIALDSMAPDQTRAINVAFTPKPGYTNVTRQIAPTDGWYGFFAEGATGHIWAYWVLPDGTVINSRRASSGTYQGSQTSGPGVFFFAGKGEAIELGYSNTGAMILTNPALIFYPCKGASL